MVWSFASTGIAPGDESCGEVGAGPFRGPSSCREGVNRMQVETNRAFPVPIEKGFNYTNDFKTWPAWYVSMAEVVEPEQAAWQNPGDEVRFIYQMLGRRVEGKAVLEERRKTERVRFHTQVPGLPVVHCRYDYSAAGEEAFVLKAILETDEPTGFLGKILDRTLLPFSMRRDLRRTMDNLDALVTADRA